MNESYRRALSGFVTTLYWKPTISHPHDARRVAELFDALLCTVGAVESADEIAAHLSEGLGVPAPTANEIQLVYAARLSNALRERLIPR